MRRFERGSHRFRKQPLIREINPIDDFHHSFISTGLIPSQVPPISRNIPREMKEGLIRMGSGIAGPINSALGGHPLETEATSSPNLAIHTPMKEPSPPKMHSRMRRLDLPGGFNRSGREGRSLSHSPYVNYDDPIPSPTRISSGAPPSFRSYLREPAIRFVKGKALEMNKEAKELNESQKESATPDDGCFVSSDEDESGGVLLHSYSPIRSPIDRPEPCPGSDLEHELVSGLASVKLGSSTSGGVTGGVGESEKDTGGSDPSGDLANDSVLHEGVSIFATNKNVGLYSRDAGDYASGNTTQITYARAAKPTSRTEYFQGVGSLKLSKEFSSNVQEKYAPRSAFGVDNVGGRGYAEFNGLPEDFSLSVDSPSGLRSPWNPRTPYRRVRAYRGGDIISGTDTSMLSETSMGFRAMERLGFEKGKGLGRNSDGIAEPIPITIKVGRGGLGYSSGSPIRPDLVGNDGAGTGVSGEATFQSRTNTSLVPYDHEEDPLVNPETLYSVDSYLARNLTRGKLTLLLRNYCDHDGFLSEDRVREVFRACMQHMDKVPGRKFSATQVEAIFRHKLRKAVNTLGRANHQSWSSDGANDSRNEDPGLE
ncbi:hypothetical protein B9Z19DRAFT_1118531 [Tuber borchii]|uniref:G-patch domain-containing protein n=1 Tax=Tuber borchii TaxID=42251 RepID=A0A2T7A8F2_TUBBO|nr:hypothetical protein B9Z19DRAFT_1118531 [Tuber borchii]